MSQEANKERVRKVYSQLKHKDPVTDEDLDFLIDFTRELEWRLNALESEYPLAAFAAKQDLETLEKLKEKRAS